VWLTIVIVVAGGVSYLWYRSSAGRSAPEPRPPAPSTITFDTSGWNLKESTDTGQVWTTSDGDLLTVRRVHGLPEAPAAGDLDAMRSDARRLARSKKGGIVSADYCQLNGVRATSLIYKREELPAYVYTGMMIIPARDPEFLITVVAGEHDVTGVRDALVSALLFEQGKLDPTQTDARRRLVGWFRDPYDRARDGEAINSVADDAEYDSLVPTHPLTKVRRTLRGIEQTITF